MIRIGIICPSEIALRRFLPALTQCENVQYVGVAVANKEEFRGATDEILSKEYAKAQLFVDAAGGKIFDSYIHMIQSDEVDAIYLPLPPGLHYQWAKQVLLAGKHALIEKPCTTELRHTQELIDIAKVHGKAIHENYMFTLHNQIAAIEDIIASGKIGEVRLYRISFGFPMRAANDFRYNKTLGGGALFDCTGYTMRYASYLLGDTARVVTGQMNYINGFDVDMYGSATMVNNKGVTAQLAWGMDNNYRCELDVWGSLGSLKTNRVLTAPVGLVPDAILKVGNEPEQMISLPADDAFKKSILHFTKCISDKETRQQNYKQLLIQASLVNQFVEFTKK